MKILALDTATSACSVALWSDGAEISRTVITERGHAEALLPMVKEVLFEASCGFAEIDALAVTVGPGAFTGLRIGLAAARGMALAAGLPCVGVTSLEAVAEAVGPEDRAGRVLLVALDSKRIDLFVQVFDAGGEPLGPPTATSPHMLPSLLPPQPVIVTGTAAAAAVEVLLKNGIDAVLAGGPGHPFAGDVARIAARRWAQGERAISPPSPMYLRPPDTGAPKAVSRTSS